MPHWDERFAAAAARHPHVRTAQYHVDILAAHLVQHADGFAEAARAVERAAAPPRVLPLVVLADDDEVDVRQLGACLNKPVGV
jgi:hypothetical protein